MGTSSSEFSVSDSLSALAVALFREARCTTDFSNICTSSVEYECTNSKGQTKSTPSSCASSRLSRMAFACSILIRPFIPSSASIRLRIVICCEGCGASWNTFDQTLRTPHATTRAYINNETSDSVCVRVYLESLHFLIIFGSRSLFGLRKFLFIGVFFGCSPFLRFRSLFNRVRVTLHE